jgi:WD40 repeat protein
VAYDAFMSYSHSADGQLAPALQRGLQLLAKPWHRLRALRVFRDETALSANPHLWTAIQDALDDSSWFVLLASPDAVASEWVGREIDHWLATKPADHILAVVTEGTWTWDATTHALAGDAVPAPLRAAFTDEPRHLDLSWARTATDLDLRNSRFRAACADLAAPIHGVPKDDLEGEDILLHRRARRIARAAVGSLALLVVVSLVFGTFAVIQRHRADHNALVADAGRIAAQARNVGADQLDLSLLLAVQSRRLVQSNATDGALEAVLARVPPGFEYSARIPETAGVVAAGADGRLLAVPGIDGVVYLVDGHDWHTLRALRGFPPGSLGLSGGVVVSADGSKVLASGNGTVMVWNVRTGAPLSPRFHVHDGVFGTFDGPVLATFDPADSKRLFTAANVVATDGNSAHGEVVHWDLRDPRHPKTLGHFDDFSMFTNDTALINVSRDGRLVAAGSLALGTTYVWDTRSGARLHAQALDGVDGGFTSDGLLMLAVRDRILFVNPATGAAQGAALTGFRLPHPAIVVSPDGRYAAASDFIDNSMRVFDLTTRRQVGRTLAVFSGPSYPVEFLPGERLVTVDTGRLVIWQFTGQTPPLATLLPMSHHGSNADGTVFPWFTPDGTQLITIDGDAHIAHRWRTSDGADLGRFLDDRAAPQLPVGFSPDGRAVVTDRPDGTAGLFDSATGTPFSVLDAKQATPLWTAWSPAGGVVATGSPDLSLVLWDVSDPRHPYVRTRIRTSGADGQGLAVWFSRDGRRVVVDNFDASIATGYDVASGRRLWTFTAPSGLSGSSFSPDGTTIALGDGNKVKMLDAASGHTRATLEHSKPDQGFEFAAGGKWLAMPANPVANIGIPPGTDTTGINTTSVVLYDTTTGQQIGEPINLAGSLPFAWAINHDGTRLATGTFNSPVGAAAIWDLDPDRWETTACRIARRNLTRAEWNQYLPGRSYARTCPQWRSGR